MVLRFLFSTAAVLGALTASATAALAFDRGCADGREAVACFEKVRRPDVYATVARPVVIAPARREVIVEPAVVEPRPYRVELVPPRVRAEHVGAHYTTVTRRQLVRPAEVRYVVQPAVVARVNETVVTHRGGIEWRHSTGRDGAERLCAVRVPARTATVARTVVVEPARRVAIETPAVYREVATPVLVRPAHTRHFYEPGVYAIEHRPVVLKPASTVIVEHPPVVGVEERRVLVRSGGYQWQRSSGYPW